MKRQSVAVRVPGSTSNLGPGFDTLGLAVRLYNRVRVTRVAADGVEIISPLSKEHRSKAFAMVEEAGRLFFRRARIPAFGVAVELTGEVPIGRGLGASATARLGVVAALNELTRARMSRQQILEIVTELEGHPDNASPAIFGGFTVAGIMGRSVRCFRFPVSPRLRFVTLFPRLEVSTEQARKLMPNTFSKSDTVHNLNRAALISAAFAARDYRALRNLFEDRVHQPYREQLIPQMARVMRAGEQAGAIGGWLSGSGSAIMCLTLEKPRAVAPAMQRKLPNSDMRILIADNEGARVQG